jgi:hypothetical protein
MGDNKLMPSPDTPCEVINAKSGYTRANTSWVIGRLVRDYDDWKDDAVSRHLKSMLDKKDEFDRRMNRSADTLPYPKKTGLCVSVYKAEEAQAGVPGYDFVYWLGFGTSILELGIAAIPCGIFGDWSILLITVVGILLSFLTGSLPQWKEEKWACRDRCEKDIILTRGNGSQHAILILGQGKGFDLEDLAAGQTDSDHSHRKETRFALLGLAVLWILLLITAAGIKENSWFLLAIGGVGIIQNVFVAGKMRHPAAYGMPLTFVEVIGSPKVMETLFEVEDKYPYDEKKKWKDLDSNVEERWKAWKSNDGTYVSEEAVDSAI